MKIFTIAFACNPELGSECGVGWSLPGEIARRHEITLVTRAMYREPVERAVANTAANDPHRSIAWRYYDLPRFFMLLEKILPYGTHIYHEIWNRRVARVFAKELSESDIVHHLTFGAAYFTPWASKVSNRFVWGPIGGGDDPIPYVFLRTMGFLAIGKEILFCFATRYACRGSWFANRYRRGAAAIVFRTRRFSEKMLVAPGCRTGVVCETAYDEPVTERTYPRKSREPMRVLMVERFIPLKGTLFAIWAFARFLSKGGQGVLTLCGKGPLAKRLKREVQKLGIAENVRFLGHLAHSDVMKELRMNDVFLHLSFHEGGSWSILEAMANGLPVICQRKSGMDDMVTDNCGVKILANTPDELAKQAADALIEYWAHPELVEQHGAAAQRRVAEEYQWSRHAARIEGVMHEIMKEQ